MSLGPSHKWVIVLIVITVVVLSLIDVVLVTNGVQGDSISALMAEGGMRVGAIPHAFGILAGHFFVPHRRRLPKWLTWTIIPIALLLMTIGGWAIGSPAWWSTVALVTGIAVGGIAWPNLGKDGE